MNFFGLLGQLGRFLPGFIQGERQAITDNWNDLNQYNQVWNGQMANALNEATFPAQVNTMLAAAANAQLASRMNGMNFMQNVANFPYNLQNVLWRSQNSIPMWQMGMQQQQANLQQQQAMQPLIQTMLAAQIQQMMNQQQAPQVTPMPSATMLSPELQLMQRLPSQQSQQSQQQQIPAMRP